MAKNVIEIDDSSFDAKVLQSDKPVLVDFWAPWCGPCKGIAPVVENLAEIYGDQFRFAKCNVDNNPLTPDKFGIRAIPTLIFFNHGQMVEKIVGMVGRNQLEDVIKKILGGAEPTAPFIVR